MGAHQWVASEVWALTEETAALVAGGRGVPHKVGVAVPGAGTVFCSVCLLEWSPIVALRDCAGSSTPAPRTVAARSGRNAPCACGSGRKSKNCHHEEGGWSRER